MHLPNITEDSDHSVPPRTVEALSCVPESLGPLLLPYHLSLPDLCEYGEDMHGLLRFFEEITGPYAQLINKAFPTGTLQRHELRAEIIVVGFAYIIVLDIVVNYGSSISIPCEAIRTFCLMQKFHSILGSPSYTVGPGLEAMMHGWVRLMLSHAHQRHHQSTDPIDISAVNKISVLQTAEAHNAWVGEKYWLREHVEA
ncbi:hypothetical protein B0H16DRAFT_1753177 [Mycena metata]|uniref:Uncharacterized protein n=1 Tax=Mycena metata TaxID=1033252 RepID=A0AAD7DCI8_9AGAR|nr:hypothetical protein B0H16DRAFT_1753177 [Mycena metata]